MIELDADQLTYLTIDGIDDLSDLVPVDAFAVMLGDWVDAQVLRERDILPRVSAGRWALHSVGKGSAVPALRHFPATPEGAFVSAQAKRDNVVALNQIARGEDPNEVVSSRVAEKLLHIVDTARGAGIPSFAVVSGDLHASVRLADLAPPLPIPLLRQSRGTIEGELVAVSFVQRSQFSVREWRSGHVVNCALDDDLRLLAEVTDALRRRVRVTGLVTRRFNGEVSVSEVERLFVFPSDDELPSPRDLVGLDVDLYGGESVDEWIRSVRQYG